MILNGSAVNVVAVNAIDKIVIALQGLSQFSTASTSELRLLARIIASNSISLSSSGAVTQATKLQSSSSYTASGTGSNILTTNMQGSSDINLLSSAINTLLTKYLGTSSMSYTSTSNITNAAILSGTASYTTSSDSTNKLQSCLTAASDLTFDATASNKLTSSVAGNSGYALNALGIATAAMVLAAETAEYSMASSGNTPKLVSSLQALSQALVNSTSSNKLTANTGSGIASFSVVADSNTPIAGIFYSGLASYNAGSSADNLLVSGLSGISNIATGTNASVYTFMNVDGNSEFTLTSESTVYMSVSLGNSDVTFIVGSAGNALARMSITGLSNLGVTTTGTPAKLVSTLIGQSNYSLTGNSSVTTRALLEGLVNYAYSSLGSNYLSSIVDGEASTTVGTKGNTYVVKVSLAVDDEFAYVVDELELVYNVS